MNTLTDRQVNSKRLRNVGRVVLICLTLGGVSIAAGGGIRTLQGWFGTAELVAPDGATETVTLQGNVVLDENGNEVGELNLTPQE